MKKRPEVFIEHMLEAIERIEAYTARMKKDFFLQDGKTQDAVIRQFEVLGEAARRISPSAVADSPIPWKAIVGLRNKLIHDYLGIDVEMVWKTAKQEAPRLKAYLRSIQRDHPRFSSGKLSKDRRAGG